jgi:phosphoribosylaminoimidazolecarboxamide formyltransferase/IMP cyclohydrolase
VKTLDPHIFAGLLAIRGNAAHEKTLTDFNIAPFDIVAVNLYPFVETISKPGKELAEAIETIDIGGPSMIRAAAKNYKSVAVVTDPAQYDELIGKLKSGGNDEAYRLTLATKAFNHTAAYDAHISGYLNGVTGDEYPQTLTFTYQKHSTMRYGENPNQSAAFYLQSGEKVQGIESAKFLHGKELSYNNISDAQAAINLAREFDEPVCAAIKHASPCGVGTGATVFEAHMRAYECDPESIFGGIICFNREVDEATATEMHKLFLEVIIAPSYSEKAYKILAKKKNLRLLTLPMEGVQTKAQYEFKSAGGGMLIQSADRTDIGKETHKLVTKAAPTAEQTKDMIFGMKVVRHVRSNAIVIVKDGRTLGIGGGQVRRSWAAEGSINHALFDLRGAVMASDALFPMPDCVELAAQAGIAAIIQPGGSINDNASIEACDKYGIAMVFTGERHFKH